MLSFAILNFPLTAVFAGLTEMLATKTQFRLIPISITSESRTRNLPKVGDLGHRP